MSSTSRSACLRCSASPLTSSFEKAPSPSASRKLKSGVALARCQETPGPSTTSGGPEPHSAISQRISSRETLGPIVLRYVFKRSRIPGSRRAWTSTATTSSAGSCSSACWSLRFSGCPIAASSPAGVTVVAAGFSFDASPVVAVPAAVGERSATAIAVLPSSFIAAAVFSATGAGDFSLGKRASMKASRASRKGLPSIITATSITSACFGPNSSRRFQGSARLTLGATCHSPRAERA